MDKKASGFGWILLGGIIELILAIVGGIAIVLYVSKSSPELLEQLNLTQVEGVKAMFGLYGVTALHMIAALIAFLCVNKPQTYLPVLFVGMVSIVLCNATTDWEAWSMLKTTISTLPGVILIVGGYVRKKSIK